MGELTRMILVNTGCYDGLVPAGNKPLPRSILIIAEAPVKATHWGWMKNQIFSDNIAKHIFLIENIYFSLLKCHWCLFLRFQLTRNQISSGNGLVPQCTMPEPILTKFHDARQHHYRQISNITNTKSQFVNVSCLILQFSLPKPLKSCV